MAAPTPEMTRPAGKSTAVLLTVGSAPIGLFVRYRMLFYLGTDDMNAYHDWVRRRSHPVCRAYPRHLLSVSVPGVPILRLGQSEIGLSVLCLFSNCRTSCSTRFVLSSVSAVEAAGIQSGAYAGVLAPSVVLIGLLTGVRRLPVHLLRVAQCLSARSGHRRDTTSSPASRWPLPS